MKDLKKFNDFSLSKMNQIYGGMEPLSTEMRGDDGEIAYTDVHHDNDNNGEWSCGDVFVLTKK